MTTPKRKPAAKPPQTETELAAYRAKLNCAVGQKALDGLTDPPDGVSRTEYALYCLLSAVEELANLLDRPATLGKARKAK